MAFWRHVRCSTDEVENIGSSQCECAGYCQKEWPYLYISTYYPCPLVILIHRIYWSLLWLTGVCMSELSSSRRKLEKTRLCGTVICFSTVLFLPRVTLQFLCLSCASSALELGSLCRVSFCTLYRDLVCNLAFLFQLPLYYV